MMMSTPDSSRDYHLAMVAPRDGRLTCPMHLIVQRTLFLWNRLMSLPSPLLFLLQIHEGALHPPPPSLPRISLRTGLENLISTAYRLVFASKVTTTHPTTRLQAHLPAASTGPPILTSASDPQAARSRRQHLLHTPRVHPPPTSANSPSPTSSPAPLAPTPPAATTSGP